MGQKGIIAIPRPVRQGGIGSNTLGARSLLLGNATAPVASVPLPANQQVLRSTGTQWATKAEGKILQVVHFETGAFITAGNSTPIPVFNLNIVTRGANSRILVMISLQSSKSSSVNAYGTYALRRATSSPAFNNIIYTFGYPFAYYPIPTSSDLYIGTVDGLWLDSPGTASGATINYTVLMTNISGEGFVQTNYDGTPYSTALLMEIGA